MKPKRLKKARRDEIRTQLENMIDELMVLDASDDVPIGVKVCAELAAEQLAYAVQQRRINDAPVKR